MHVVDASTATKPVFLNTWFFALVKSAFNKVTGSKFSSTVPKKDGNSVDGPEKDLSDDDGVSSDSGSKSGYSTPGENGAAKRLPTSKAGGARRKNVRRK